MQEARDKMKRNKRQDAGCGMQDTGKEKNKLTAKAPFDRLRIYRQRTQRKEEESKETGNSKLEEET